MPVAKGLVALKSYAVKYAKRKKLEESLEKIKDELNKLTPSVLLYFEKHGVDRQSVAGYTIAPRYELWASRHEDITPEQMHDALIAAGLKQYATETMNHQSMSAYIREIYRELVEKEREKSTLDRVDINVNTLMDEIVARHPELYNMLAIREDLKLSVTKSKASAARTKIGSVMANKAQPKRLPRDVEEDVIN